MKDVYLNYLAPLSVLLPIIVLLVFAGRMATHIRILLGYLVMAYFVSRESTMMALNKVPNLWLLHFYTLTEGVMLLFFFRALIVSKQLRRITEWLLVIFPLFCVANMLFLQSLSAFNTYARSLEAIMMMGLCLGYWWQGQEQQEGRRWSDVAENWLVAGIFIYFSASFFLFLFSNQLMAWLKNSPNNRVPFVFVWYGHATLVVIMYLMFSIGFYKCRRATISSS